MMKHKLFFYQDEINEEGIHSSSRISKNISAAKGFSALIVMAGHIGTGIPNYWVVVTIGLLIFTISSGYFTWIKYGSGFQLKQFWISKIIRLIPRLLAIELFLFFLFIAKNSEGLWTWDTALYIIPGLPGFLGWFHVPNQSPFGAGMWYLSLLLIFYILYPVISKAITKIGKTTILLIILCLFFLHLKIIYGHALWLTAAGFFMGIYLAFSRIRMSALFAFLLTGLVAIIMVVFHNVFEFDLINFFFILAIATGGILFLLDAKLPESVIFIGTWLSGLLLEIYLLHPYLQIQPTGIYRIDQILTVILILFISYFLSLISRRMTLFLKK